MNVSTVRKRVGGGELSLGPWSSEVLLGRCLIGTGSDWQNRDASNRGD